MEESKPSLGLLFISFSLLFFAGVLTFLSWQRYRSIDRVIPDGSMIGDIPITGLSVDEAVERVRSVYGLPVDLDYLGSTIRLEIPDNIDYTGLRDELTGKIDEPVNVVLVNACCLDIFHNLGVTVVVESLLCVVDEVLHKES